VRRAALERTWLREGQREISLTGVVAAAGANDPAFAPLQRAVDATPKPHRAMTPRAWAEAWSSLLGAAGWPGSRSLTSAEWQARRAWDEMLAEFARLGLVAPRMQRAKRTRRSSRSRARKCSSPNRRRRPSRSWAASRPPGSNSTACGSQGSLPRPGHRRRSRIRCCRSHGSAIATSAIDGRRELDYANALVKQWASAASEVVFSHAVTEEDHPRTITSLVIAATPWAAEEARRRRLCQLRSAPHWKRSPTIRAPPLPIGSRMRGGAGLIAAQGDCPFRAMTLYRLRADTWPVPLDGFSALERGILVHAALAAFWRDVGDHATLIALTAEELGRRIDRAATQASQCLPSARWSRLPPVVAAGEAQRLARIVRAWLDDFERPRPPFVVSEVEVSRPLALNGLELSLRVDRIDALADGGIAIIDYKTGFASPPLSWFDERPEAPQLGLYWQSQQALERSPPVRALAYAQLRPGELKAVGLAEDESVWPRLSGSRLAALARTRGLAARSTRGGAKRSERWRSRCARSCRGCAARCDRDLPALRVAAAVQDWHRSGPPRARGRRWLIEAVSTSSPTIRQEHDGSARSIRRARSWSRRRRVRKDGASDPAIPRAAVARRAPRADRRDDLHAQGRRRNARARCQRLE
jgi:exodeoxyribonuclease-5